MIILPRWLVLCCTLFFLSACGDNNVSVATASGNDTPTEEPSDPPVEQPVPAPPLDCDPLVPSYCGFPYPNNYWTEQDISAVTGMRLALPQVIMPANSSGTQSDPSAFNEMDGFSAGIAAMAHLPGAVMTGLATPDSIEQSLAADSPTVLIDAGNGERLAHWVDIDEYVVQAKLRVDAGDSPPNFDISRDIDDLRQEQAFMLRPAIRPEDATRYIVAIRGVVDSDGALIEPSAGFRALRDGTPSDDDIIESRRAHFEEIFSLLEAQGIARDSLQLAWDYTTASRENNTAAMVHIRDDALANYPQGVPYSVAPKMKA